MLTNTPDSKNEPLISIIIPCHNVADTIVATMRSVSRQLYKNIEVICVENGSSDNTLQALEALANNDSRINIKSTGALSPGAARMLGVEESHGEYIAFLDGDDFYEVDFISEMLAVILHDGSDLVQCAIRYSFDDRSYTSGAPAGIIEGLHCAYRLDSLDTLPYLQPQLWNKLYRRHVWEKVTINDAYFEDAECLPKLAKQCNKISIISDALITYNKKFSKISGSMRADLSLAHKYFDNLLLSQTPYLEENFSETLRIWGSPLPACVYANLSNYLKAVDISLEYTDAIEKNQFLEQLDQYVDNLRSLASPQVFDNILAECYKMKNLTSLKNNPLIECVDNESYDLNNAITKTELTFGALDAKTPKDPNLWVFTTWGHYGRHTLDSPRALFEVVKSNPDIQKVILMNNAFDQDSLVVEGVNVVFLPLHSLEGLDALSKSGVIVTAYSLHNLFGYRNLADTHERKIIQTWHGIPIKKVGLAVGHRQEPYWDTEHDRYFAWPSSSETDQETMIRSFSPRRRERIKLSGLPRHDFLKCDEDTLPSDYKEHLNTLRRRTEGKRLVMFAATWRENAAERISFDLEQLQRINSLFKKHNAVFGVRLHPNMKRHGISFPIISPNIIQISDLPDANIVMRLCSCVVTDYSSIYLDFMQLDRPVILYNPDIKTYGRNRGLNYVSNEFTPHKQKFHDFEAFMKALDAMLVDDTATDECYHAVYNRFNKFYADGLAAKRLLEQCKLI